MGTTRGRKKSGRRSRNSKTLSLLSKEIVLRGGNSSGATDTKWVPVGVYTVTSTMGVLQVDSCPNNVGKDGPLGTATLFKPFSIDIDSAGNIIILERDTEKKVRIIRPEGNVSTLVTRGDITDGSLSNAGIGNTFMMVLNKANDVFYFLDESNHKLRCMVEDSGNTFSGKPVSGFGSGINTIITTSGNKTVDGNQDNAYLHHPLAIGIDPRGTRMYIGQSSGDKYLRIVDITGPRKCYVSTLFESGGAARNIVVDNSGNVFFTIRDEDNNTSNKHAIWKFVPPAAGERAIAGSTTPLYSFTDPIYGPKIFAGNLNTPGYKDAIGTTARFRSPMGMCVDAKNNLYVADCGNNLIRYITPAGQVYTYAGVQSINADLNGVPNGGDGTHMTARFSNPISVAIDKFNNLFVLDKGRSIDGGCSPYTRIRKISRVPPLTLSKVEYDSVTISWPPASEWMPGALPGEDSNSYSYIITPAVSEIQVSSDRISSPLRLSNLLHSTRYSVQIVVSNPSYTVTTPPLTTPPLTFVTKNTPIPPLTLAKVETNSVTITWPPASEWIQDIPQMEETTYSYNITPVDRDFEVFSDTITSPLTITNLSDSTRYSIEISVSNPSRRTLTTPPFPFATKIEESKFAIRTPVSTTVAGKSTNVPNITTTILEWDGVVGADTLSYSISPPDAFSRTRVTLPRNHKTPYTISDLDASKTYTITLTASITNTTGVNGGPPVTYSVTSPSSTFTTPPLRSMKIGTICGILEDGSIKEGGEVTNATKIPRPASTSTVKNPRGVVLDKHGNLFVTSNSCVLKIAPPKTNVYVYMRGQVPSVFLPTPHTTSNSTVTIYAGRSVNDNNNEPSDTTGDNIRFYNMSGMAYDPIEDAIYVSDSQLHRIVKLTSDSTGLVTSKVLGKKDDGNPTKFVNGPVAEARFNTPKGIAIGPDGSLFIADCYNNAVRRIYQGNVTTLARSKMDGEHNLDNVLSYPYGIAALYDGSVYVTSTWRNCIKKLTPNGDGTYAISLYAGEDSPNASDTDGTLLNARFNKPEGLFVDTNNNIYVYDVGNYKIKLISGGRVMTVFGSDKGYRNGDKSVAQLKGASLGERQQQDDYAGLTSDNNGNIYFTDWGNGLVRCAFPEPPPIIDKATYDAYWSERNEAIAVAQRSSSAISAKASSAKAQKASSSRESSAKASSAKAQIASSPVAHAASSAVIQRASSAIASSAVAQAASSPVAQVASSAVTQRASSAIASSAVAQVASSAVAERASSALAQRASSAEESSAVIQRASSSVAQVASSALAQRESSAEESSAVIQRASSSVAQVASSALAQRESSAQESSAVIQRASSARELQALAAAVSEKDDIVRNMKIIQSDLNEVLAMLYSKNSTEQQKNAAEQFLRSNMPDLEQQWAALSQVSASIFSIAPMYQDRIVQTAVYRDKYLESKTLFKIYDLMRKSYITIDSNGYIVSNVGPMQRLL